MASSQSTLREETNEQLVPVQKSCCYCIPQGIGITILATIKLMVSYLLLMKLVVTMLAYTIFGPPILFHHFLMWIAITLGVVDLIIAVIVFISACLNNLRIMKMYYIYSVCIFGALTFLCGVIIYIFTGDLVFLSKSIFIFFLIFLMQEYLHHLMKSEVIYLESREQFLL